MKKQLLEYVGSLQGKKIACCLNPIDKHRAQASEIPQWVQEDIDMLELCGVQFVALDLRKGRNHVDEILQGVDGIYVCGGETDHLVRVATESNFSELLKDFLTHPDHFYCSTSAGSCRLGSHIRVYDENEEVIDVISGENWLPCMIIPHRSRDTAGSRKRYLLPSIEKVYNAGCATLCITDNQAIISDGNTFTIINNF